MKKAPASEMKQTDKDKTGNERQCKIKKKSCLAKRFSSVPLAVVVQECRLSFLLLSIAEKIAVKETRSEQSKILVVDSSMPILNVIDDPLSIARRPIGTSDGGETMSENSENDGNQQPLPNKSGEKVKTRKFKEKWTTSAETEKVKKKLSIHEYKERREKKLLDLKKKESQRRDGEASIDPATLKGPEASGRDESDDEVMVILVTERQSAPASG